MEENRSKRSIRWVEAKHQLAMVCRNPILLTTILVVPALLIMFVIHPIGQVIRVSLTPGGEFSLDTYTYLLSQWWLRQTFRNSILLGVIVATLGTIVGFTFAFALNRGDIPWKRFFRLMAQLPIISPPFMFCLSVILLLGRNGIITKQLLGLRNFDIYGLKGLVLVQTMGMFPVAFMVLDGVLQAINPDLEEGALNLGASKGKVFWTVTVPLCVPGIASSWLLVFVTSLADFANPVVISGKFDVLSVQAYFQFTGLYNMPRGSAVAILLLIPAMLAFVIERYWVSRKSYVTVTGKPTTYRIIGPSKATRRVLTAVCAVISGVILLFYITVIAGAFVKLWGVDWSLTLDHFRYAWDVGKDSVRSTLVLSAWATPITGLLGMVIAFLLVRTHFPGKNVLGFTSMLAFAVPGTVVGIGYILAFNQPPLLLTGTAAIIVLCFIFREMPVAIEAGVASLIQIDPSIEEASTNLGADTSYTFRRITMPLVRPAFIAGLSYSFVRSMTAVSAVIFLVSARWNHLTSLIYAQTEIMRLGAASVLSLFLIIIVLVIFGLMRAFLGEPVTRVRVGS
ncbi:MAG: iron ABC transporter permease [Firmicutes bacterium]|nr:iron ABC transporter permease [Bacillota bacterium]